MTSEQPDRCPNWCRGAHDGATHGSAPYSFAAGFSLQVVRGVEAADGPANIRVLSSSRPLNLSVAQARQLAADLREYAELAQFAEAQWRGRNGSAPATA
jgi:hypothetical protein